MQRHIGFSTGVLWRSGLSEEEKVRAIRQSGADAIEFGYINPEEFQRASFAHFVPETVKGFAYVSFHAPAYPYRYDGTSAAILYSIAALQSCLERKFDAVVFHPDHIVDLEIFGSLPYPVAFENMDRRKKAYKAPWELEQLLRRFPKAGFVLDVNHAFTCAPPLPDWFDLVNDFRIRLEGRLAHIHASGYGPGSHEALHKTRQHELVRGVRSASVPLILEGVMGPEDLKEELEYVRWWNGGSR